MTPTQREWTPQARPGYERRPPLGRAVDSRTPPPHRQNKLAALWARLRGLWKRPPKNRGAFLTPVRLCPYHDDKQQEYLHQFCHIDTEKNHDAIRQHSN
jgi:hypothetical protein